MIRFLIPDMRLQQYIVGCYVVLILITVNTMLTQAFIVSGVSKPVHVQTVELWGHDNEEGVTESGHPRRRTVMTATIAAVVASTTVWSNIALPVLASSDTELRTQQREFVQEYDDFVKTASGWSYRDVTTGERGETSSTSSAVSASKGDRVVYDWSGFTIGYFGRPFQAKGGPQGGAFDKDLDYARTVVGSGQVLPALDQAFIGMKPGGVRQVIVPYGTLSYPANDPSHDVVGPKPSTFSGQRALNFVLDNERVDRTLLFNVKVIRVDKPDGKGNFIRG
jgi:hypothetical protein